jgi:probable phosphoglycerate mutase
VNGPKLWLVRHGETEWSAARRHTGRTDVPLTAMGEREALALAPLLARQNFDLVGSSPRQRALRTAELAGFEPSIDGDLAEWDYGDLEGLTAEEIRATYPNWSIWHGPWPGGEQPARVVARARRVVERAMAMPAGANALVFAHGHILRVLAVCWLERPVADGCILALGTGSISVLGWEHDQRPAIEHWNLQPGFPAGPATAGTTTTAQHPTS